MNMPVRSARFSLTEAGTDGLVHKLVGKMKNADIDNGSRKPDGAELRETLLHQPLSPREPGNGVLDGLLEPQ